MLNVIKIDQLQVSQQNSLQGQYAVVRKKAPAKYLFSQINIKNT